MRVTVFDDVNRDGRRGAGEVGIVGVTMRLFDDATGQRAAERITGADGSCRFDGLPTNGYRMRQINLVGYLSSTPDEIRFHVGSPWLELVFGDYRFSLVSVPLVLR